MGLETNKIIKIHLLTPPSAASKRVRQPALQQDQQESGSNEVGNPSLLGAALIK